MLPEPDRQRDQVPRRRAAARARVDAERDGDVWRVRACADNGIGIEPEYAERIFVIFQRLHARDEYEGTASAWRCAARSSSATAGASGCEHRRRTATGATFCFTLPVPDTHRGGHAMTAEHVDVDRGPAGRGRSRRRRPHPRGVRGQQGRNRLHVVTDGVEALALPAPRGRVRRRAAPGPRSCSTSTCRARTAARCSPRSRRTPSCARSRSSC